MFFFSNSHRSFVLLNNMDVRPLSKGIYNLFLDKTFVGFQFHVNLTFN